MVAVMSTTEYLIANARLHGIIASIEREMVVATPTMRASWTDLLAALQLTPVLETKTCPSCGALCIREAKRCASCWSALTAS